MQGDLHSMSRVCIRNNQQHESGDEPSGAGQVSPVRFAPMPYPVNKQCEWHRKRTSKSCGEWRKHHHTQHEACIKDESESGVGY
eukprot:scaffold102853_cov45-Tisochrysis_lutea.AAC.1